MADINADEITVLVGGWTVVNGRGWGFAEVEWMGIVGWNCDGVVVIT
jgi:hypothetical protein